ncbi:MAG: 3-dehydroquinate synthase [Candidatus Levybacteria bacterium]|nr:3-dehydroquinate synthase [Candidatus Levybacteria bacterium]
MNKIHKYSIPVTEDTEVIIGKDILSTIGSVIKPYAYSKVAILVDATTQKLFLPTIKASLTKEGIAYCIIAIPGGEKSKDFAHLQTILSAFYTNHLDRKSVVVALGGGVVGDIATLAAGLYFRGIDCIQIPTTLLSQVDSSLGGKGAVDLETHKNTIGIIRQPRVVVIDTKTIQSLPATQMRSGMGEVIKYAIAMNPKLFTLLAETDGLAQLDEIVATCVTLKMEIVEKDPQDITTQRAVVNFGHTLGQAIELKTTLTHGEAISIGMAFVIKLSQKMQILSDDEAEKSLKLLQKYDLPITISGVDKEKAIQQMKKDKKSVGGKIRFVLLEGIGKPKANCIVEESLVDEVLSRVLL